MLIINNKVLTYMRKIDLVYDGADLITLNRFNEVLYKLL